MKKDLYSFGALCASMVMMVTIISSCSKEDSQPIGQASQLKATYVADGYAAGTTGGAGGTSVTVTTAAALTTAATSSSKMIITVSGIITLSDNLHVTSNKTIQGANTSATINGDLYFKPGVTNVIIQSLNFTNPSGTGDADGISVKGATKVFVTHCTFNDCADGSCDITEASDFVTVSWCRFRYATLTGHDFVNLIGASDSQTGDAGKLHVTMHHNWYDSGCKERMPRVRFGRVHCYNNYYGASGSNYCLGVGNDCQILLENGYFDSQAVAWKNYSSSGHQGLIHWNSGNYYVSTPIPTWAPNSTVFTPPYSYTLAAGSSVKSTVTSGAGNR